MRIRLSRLPAGLLVAALLLAAPGLSNALAPSEEPKADSRAGRFAQEYAAKLSTRRVRLAGIGTRPAEGAGVPTGKLIVTVDSGAGAADAGVVDRGVGGEGGSVLKRSRDGRRLLVKPPRGMPVDRFRKRLERRAGIGHVEPDLLMRISATPSDPYYKYQWGLPKIGAPAAWDASKGASSVKIAILDTGVDLDHPDLGGTRIDTANDKDFVNGDSTADDDQGHGTHVAGVAAASMNNAKGGTGLAPLSTILPVKVLDANGSGSTYDIAEGVRWAADKGAKVVNLSLGGGGYNSTLASAISYAHSKNVVVVAAVGNTGSYGVQYPARYADVLGVGASGRDDARASFSTYGPDVDITAPGVEILSTVRGGGYGYMSGTSMATPFVAGAAGLLRAKNPTWTRQQVAAALTSTAWDLGTAGKDDYFGYGRLRIAAALGHVAPPAAPSDDNPPGVPLPASPVAGTLSRTTGTTDIDDVYAAELGPGDRITASVSAPVGTDFDLYLYPPGTVDVASDPFVATSSGSAYPKTLDFTVPLNAHGTYYLDVYSESGSGAYTVTYAITKAGGTDRDVPGVPLPTSPVKDSLDETIDPVDLYAVELGAGQRLNASLLAGTGTDFDVVLFPPDTKSIYTSRPMAGAIGSAYPDAFTYSPGGSGGTYYLAVYTYSGSGAYTLAADVTDAAPDDNIPGVAAARAPMAGTVDRDSDPDDVYAVDLDEGDRLSVEMSSSAPADFDAYLFGPGSDDVNTDVPVTGSEASTFPERFTYTVPQGSSGVHYVDVYAYRGEGAYSMGWSVAEASRLVSKASNRTTRYGERVAVTGLLSDASGTPLPGRVIVLQSSTNGTTFKNTGTATVTDTTGAFTLSAAPTSLTYLRPRFAGADDYAASTGSTMRILPKAYLTRPTGPSYTYLGRTFTSIGYMKPRHKAGTYPVRLSAYRYERGKWVYRKSFNAKVSNYSSYSKYIDWVKLPYRGKWRIRAYHYDSGHAKSYSSYRYITVK